MLPYSNGSPQFMVLKKQPTPWAMGGCFFNAFVKFPILAKGEPLTVLAAPTFIIRYIGLFSYEFLRNKYTKFSILELAIFTDLDFVHFTKCPITGIFRLFTAKRFHRNPPAEPFYVSFYTTNCNNVLDQTVVKITVTETVHPG